jgi:hypothetical protein
MRKEKRRIKGFSGVEHEVVVDEDGSIVVGEEDLKEESIVRLMVIAVDTGRPLKLSDDVPPSTYSKYVNIVSSINRSVVEGHGAGEIGNLKAEGSEALHSREAFKQVRGGDPSVGGSGESPADKYGEAGGPGSPGPQVPRNPPYTRGEDELHLDRDRG